MKRWILRFSLPLLLLFAGQAAGQPEPIKVGITTVPPFVMETDSGEWEGISIDL